MNHDKENNTFLVEENIMAKKKEVVPEIVDSVETLEAKMKAMREAQKVSQLTHRSR